MTRHSPSLRQAGLSHVEGNEHDDSYFEGVQLSGVKLVPSAIDKDESTNVLVASIQ